jgi:hypothetical protein
MKTAWQTTHKHSISGKATTSTGGHAHELDEAAAAIAALEARVTKLEAPQPPAPIEPPPSRPFPAPVTTATHTVPSIIDHTGLTNAATLLNTFIGTVPDGSIIDFAIPGAIYRLDVGLLLSGRHNLVLEGHGTTTLRLAGSGNDYFASAFLLIAAISHIAIHGFTVLGNATNWPNTGAENQNVLTLLGWYDKGACSYVEMSAVTGSHVFGDGVYLEGSNGGTYPPSTNIWIHHNSLDHLGRNAISLINCADVLVEYNDLDFVGYHVFDIEPNFAAEECTRAIIRNNTVGSYSHRSDLGGFFVQFYAVNDSILSYLTVKDNTCAGIAVDGKYGAPRALNSSFLGKAGGHGNNIIFTGNWTTRAVAGPAVFYFKYVDGVTCTGNTQPLLSSTLVQADNCTGTVMTPNP